MKKLETIARRAALSVMLAIMVGVAVFAPLSAQDGGVPTLTPPTLVPASEAAINDALPTESGLARMTRDGVVRVGTLYNEPPFGELSIRNVVVGFDADLARAMAEAWGWTAEQVQFVQVTRQTAIEMLTSGQIDLLMGAQVHTRELDERVEFSQTYYPGQQTILLRNGDGATVLGHMADRIVGVVVGTRGSAAAEVWRTRATDYAFNVRTFYTLDQAIGALNSSEIDGVLDSRIRLERAIAAQPDNYRILGEAVAPEPVAIAVRRQDVNLRNLVNRTLQYLFQSGKLDEVYRANFNAEGYPSATFTTWGNIGDAAPRLDQFGQDFPLPQRYVIGRMQGDGVLRVAGLIDVPADAPESVRRLDTANRALVNALAARWNVTVSVVPSGASPLDQVANGEADLAIGVEADWANVARVDYTSAYLRRGLLLMVEENAQVGGFGDLRGKWIGVFNGDDEARAVVAAEAERARAIIDDYYTIGREQDAAYTMVVDNNADAVLADSTRLIPQVEANAGQVRFVTDADGRPVWYSRRFLAMAVPRNDIDFRLLVEYTLQDMEQDGSMAALLAGVTVPGDTVAFEVWP